MEAFLFCSQLVYSYLSFGKNLGWHNTGPFSSWPTIPPSLLSLAMIGRTAARPPPEELPAEIMRDLSMPRWSALFLHWYTDQYATCVDMVFLTDPDEHVVEVVDCVWVSIFRSAGDRQFLDSLVRDGVWR